ncbi:hypothetical protein ABH930_004475 [Kitasatospora sp. GAS204A]|nr:hypothetical protein [Kitasatospora sp. GAS204B]
MPNWQPGIGTEVLPSVYRDIVEAVADASGPVHAKQIVPRIGLPAETAKIEGTRSKLKRLDAFYRVRIPLPCSTDMPLVLQVDGKGVVMRPEALREATRRAAAKTAGAHRTRLAPGEKPNRKRMATVACVFDTRPAPRRPHDVIHPPGGRSETRRPRPGPKAENKWCTASLLRPPEQVIADAFDQAEARDPKHLRPWIVLVDGSRHQLDLITAEAHRRGVTVHILLDFIHVAELSRGARPRLPQTRHHRGRGLGGRPSDRDPGRPRGPHRRRSHRRGGARAPVSHPARGRRRLPPLPHWPPRPTPLRHRPRQGWPIATGAVEGACRHLIADRLDITGARWGLPGAEAVLRLRALVSNGDLDTYRPFHATREHQRLYTLTA